MPRIGLLIVIIIIIINMANVKSYVFRMDVGTKGLVIVDPISACARIGRDQGSQWQ